MAEEKKKEKIQTMEFSLEIELIDTFQFNVKYDLPDIPDLIIDEPPKIGGEGKGPNPSRMIGTAVASCMASSLVHCLRRAKADVRGITAKAKGLIGRNDEGLLRLQKVDVTIFPKLGSSADEAALKRCSNIFEKYCIVTDSLRAGLPVDVKVEPEFAED